MQSYFAVPKTIRVISTHDFIIKILNKQELQQIAINHSSGIDFRDFMNLYKNVPKNNIHFLTIDTTLASNNSLHSRKDLLEII